MQVSLPLTRRVGVAQAVDEIDLGGLGRALWRRKRWIIGLTLLAAGLAFIAVNLITPARRKRALALARDGECYSMAHNAEFQPGPDNTTPVISKMTRTGTAASATGPGGTGDSFFMSYHGYAHTHMDTICHFLYEGKMYNGYSQDEVTEDGAAKNSIINFKNGIITRGVLMDMARYKGVDWLEPGTAIYPEDLEGWEKKAGVKVRSGDVMTTTYFSVRERLATSCPWASWRLSSATPTSVS